MMEVLLGFRFRRFPSSHPGAAAMPSDVDQAFKNSFGTMLLASRCAPDAVGLGTGYCWDSVMMTIGALPDLSPPQVGLTRRDMMYSH